MFFFAAAHAANSFEYQSTYYDNPFSMHTPAPRQPFGGFLTPPAVQPPQPVQSSQPQTDELVRESLAVAWQIGMKVWEPKWMKASPGSLLVYKLSDQLAASPDLTPEGRQWLNLIKAIAFIYGLSNSDN